VPELIIDSEGVAKWKEFAMETDKGKFKADTIRNGIIH